MNARAKVLLVGSIGLADVETVFQILSKTLGKLATRYPDGECGPRNRWIMWQSEVFDSNDNIELDERREILFGGETQIFEKFRLKLDVNLEKIDLGLLGYASEAAKSYEIFKLMREAGTIPSATRLQLSLPTPVAVIAQHIAAKDQAVLAKVYESTMKKEIESIIQVIPADELAIQWDVCREVLAAEDAWSVYYDDLIDGAIERLQKLSQLVPEPCQLGFHLCYGDPGHKHIKEPENLEICVEFANGICAGSDRNIDWIHMPVPRGRDDSAYFSPLEKLACNPETELYLGLIHLTDGIEGAMRRIDSANEFVSDFGIATECGFGRRPSETIPDLLLLHAEVASCEMQKRT